MPIVSGYRGMNSIRGTNILFSNPVPAETLTYANGYFDSMYGRIESGWNLEKDKLTYRAVVPANTTATLYFPADNPDMIYEGGLSVKDTEGIYILRF